MVVWGRDNFDSDLGDLDLYLLVDFASDDGTISSTAGMAIILEEAPGATSGLEDDESCGKSEPVPVGEVPVFPFDIDTAILSMGPMVYVQKTQDGGQCQRKRIIMG